MKFVPKGKVRVLIIILALLIAMVALATAYLERLAKPLVISKIQAMGVQASIRDLDIGLFRGVVSLSGLDLRSPEGNPLLVASYAGVNLSFWQAIQGRPEIKRAALEGAQVNARINEQGSLDWSALLASGKAPSPSASPKSERTESSLSIGNITLRDVALTVEDSRQQSPIHTVRISVGRVLLDLSGGRASVDNLHLETDSQKPLLAVGALKAHGRLSTPPYTLQSLEVQDFKGQADLDETGEVIVVKWLQELGRTSGLVQQVEQGATDDEASSGGAPFSVPQSVNMKRMDLELSYPDKTGARFKEQFHLTEAMMDNQRGQIQLSGLRWNNNRSVLGEEPVLEIGSLNASGEFLADRPQMASLQLSQVSLNAVKQSSGLYDAQDRIARLLEVLQSKRAPTSMPATETRREERLITGKVTLEDIRCRLLVAAPDAEFKDNRIELQKATLDFQQGTCQVSNLVLGDTGSSASPPVVSIPVFEARGNLSVPPPGVWTFEQISVKQPVLRLVYDSQGNLDLLRRVEQLQPDVGKDSKEQHAESSSSLRIQVERADIAGLDLTVTHLLATGESVRYELRPAEIVLSDIVYPKGGDGWSSVQVKTAVASPTEGTMNVDARLRQKDLPNTFEGKLDVHLEDITALRPYYEAKLPVGIVSGQLNVTANGRCDAGQLNVPFSVAILSPELSPRESAGLNPLKQLSQANAMALVSSLKDSKGNLVYEGNITGTLDNPSFVDPFKAMGQILQNQLQTNLKRLPELLGQPKQLVEDAAQSVGGAAKTVTEGVGDTLKGLLSPGKKKE